MRFLNKVAIVTGAASGIGLETAKRLGAEGAYIMVVDINREKIEEAVSEVTAAGAAGAWGSLCDVSCEEVVRETVTETIGRFGRLDVVVNNAGTMVFKPIIELTCEDWLYILNVDLMGAVHFTKQAFLRMVKGGAIVNVSSVHAERTSPLVAPYAAAKAALLSLTRSASIEGHELGIRVNAVLPGAVDTSMLWNNPNISSGAETIDTDSVGKPEDVASLIAYLASDEARFVTGAAIKVDGGRLARL